MDWSIFIEGLHLPLSLLMLGLFSLIALWAYAPGRRAAQERYALIPFDDRDR